LEVTLPNGKGVVFDKEDLAAHDWKFKGDVERWGCQGKNGTVVILDKLLDEACQKEGSAREFVSRVQQLRKQAGITSEDAIKVYVDTKSPELTKILSEYDDFIKKRVRVSVQNLKEKDPSTPALIQKERKKFMIGTWKFV